MKSLLALVALALSASGCKKDEDPLPSGDTGAPTTTTPVPAPSVIALGSPMYSVTDIALFTGPAGDGTALCVMDPNHEFDLIVWSPGEAHPAPYSNEITGRLAGCGLTAKTTFAPADMEGPNGIWLGLIIEAAAGNAPGSSPDFPIGDVIYNDRFPFVVDTDVRWNDILADPDHDFNYPAPDTWGHVVTGLSHFPLLYQTSLDQMPAGASSPGEYAWHVKIRDATSVVAESGFDIVVPYVVESPE